MNVHSVFDKERPPGRNILLRESLRRVTLHLSLLFVGLALLGRSYFAAFSQDPVRWMWSGAVTPTSAVIKARLENLSKSPQFLLCAGEDCDPRPWDGMGKPPAPDEYGIVTVELEGLRPETRYRYGFRVDNRTTPPGSFRTFAAGPMSFRVAFASCATTGSESSVFTSILEMEPDVFLHMGDFHYEDIKKPDVEVYLEAYDKVLRSKTQSELFRRVPIVYIWDDHDYGPDNSDRTAPGRLAALDAYRRAVPHYPLASLPPDRMSIHQAFTVGRVRFLATDLRAMRDPAGLADGPDKSMLGEDQKAWLLDEFARAMEEEFPLVGWVSTVPWIASAEAKKLVGWAPYSFERSLLAERIRSLGLDRRLLMLSGDAHMVAIDDGSHSNFAPGAEAGERGFPVVQAAPLDRYPRKKGGPYSHGTETGSKFFPWSKVQQFGFMEVLDDGSRIEVWITGRDKRGRILDGMELRLLCADGGCEVVP